MQFGKNLAARMPMQTMFGSVAKDGDQMFVAVPENKTLEFYQYLRGYGLCFTCVVPAVCSLFSKRRRLNSAFIARRQVWHEC